MRKPVAPARGLGASYLAMIAGLVALAAGAESARADDAVFPPYVFDWHRSPWLAVAPDGWIHPSMGEDYRLTGTGPLAGQTRTYACLGTETVLGVGCWVYRVPGFGVPPTTECYDYRVAQDADGNVRYLKVTGTDASGDPVSWQAATAEAAPVLLPRWPEMGQTFNWWGGQTIEIVATDGVVARAATGMGPYRRCVEVRWTDGARTRRWWMGRYVGVVREDWSDAATGAAWERVFDAADAFPERELRKRIRYDLDKPIGDVTLEDLQAMSVLEFLSDWPTLEGVQLCDNLAELHWGVCWWPDQEPIDLSPLAELGRLEVIWLSEGGPVGSLEPLAGLTSLRKLGLDEAGIDDVTPLAGLTDLERLELGYNYVADITPLAGMARMEHLELQGNRISDIAPLAGMTVLRELGLTENRISDISALVGMSQLAMLHASQNEIEDASVLSMLTALESLAISENPIGTLPDLSGLTQLRELRIRRCAVNDLSGLAGLPAITQLTANANDIEDLAPLAGLTTLKEVNLAGNWISDLSPLAGLPELSTLSLYFNQIVDVSPLASLESLRYLDLRWNQVNDMSPLVPLPSLEELDLSGNAMTAVPDLSALNARALYLSGNRICDLSAMGSPSALRYLYLEGNGLFDLRGPNGLTNLRVLDLDDNWITDLQPLADWDADDLEHVDVSGNPVSSIGALSQFTALETVTLADCFVSDLGPLVANSGIDDGDFVSVPDNPLSAEARDVQIPALRARDVSVWTDDAVPPLVATVDRPWTYQNAPQTTGGRNACVLTLTLNVEGTYEIAVTVMPESLGAVTCEPTADPLVWLVKGGRAGAEPAGAVALGITATRVDDGSDLATPISLTVRRLGDVDGDGSATGTDKFYFNQRLNNVPTPYPDYAYDLNGDGTVTGLDKQVMNQILNNVPAP